MPLRVVVKAPSPDILDSDLQAMPEATHETPSVNYASNCPRTKKASRPKSERLAREPKGPDWTYESAVLTFSNLALALVPIVVTVPIHTTMIRAIMTAYSTAVGPSSETMNFLTLSAKFFISNPLLNLPPESGVPQESSNGCDNCHRHRPFEHTCSAYSDTANASRDISTSPWLALFAANDLKVGQVSGEANFSESI